MQQKIFHIRSLSGLNACAGCMQNSCDGCASGGLKDNIQARTAYLQEISELGGIDKIPAPYRAYVETFETDTAPGFGLYKPVERFESLQYAQGLFNALPGDLNPNKNTFVKGIYEMLPTLSAKLREAYYSITKDYFVNTWAVYYFLGIRGTSNRGGNIEAAFQKAMQVFTLRLEHWNTSEKETGSTWWKSIAGAVLGAVPFVGGLLSEALNLFNFNSAGMTMTLPNGMTIDTTKKSGFSLDSLPGILIIGAGAGLLLSILQKKRGNTRGRK